MKKKPFSSQSLPGRRINRSIDRSKLAAGWRFSSSICIFISSPYHQSTIQYL